MGSDSVSAGDAARTLETRKMPQLTKAEQKVQRYETKLAKIDAKNKTTMLRAAEAGSSVATAFGLGFLEEKMPKAFAFGPGDRFSIEHAAAIGGLYLAFTSKSNMTSEVGMGVGLAALAGIFRGWGRSLGG